MASNPSGTSSVVIPGHRTFGRLRLLFTAGLLLAFLVCLIFAWTTRDAMAHLPFLKGRGKTAAGHNSLVDLRPWQTAEALAALAVTSEEHEFARDAARLADHEVDQAFASALRQASAQHNVLTGEALTLAQKVKQFQRIVKEDQAHMQSLSVSSATKNGAPVALTDDLDVAKAQLALDSDELADAQEDLARASGDQRGRIQQELAAHQAAMRKSDAQSATGSQVAVVSVRRYGTLAGRLEAWFDQRSRFALLQQAIQQAQADAVALTAQHNQIESQANAGSSSVATDKAGTLATLNSRAARSQLLAIYDDRIQTQQQLAAVYAKWSDQVLLQHRIVLHLLLESFAWIVFILICVILLDALVRHLIERPALDRRRVQTLRIVFKLGIQVVGAVLILLVVFGAPSQTPTILGLTTAGFTVAMQDFILAFFGWFILMGKNGVRVGDWVEINGVGGEVVEIGLFRTTLLETGNWTDKGHPTGRRVTFINNFAITGHYFNFSTTGQWMWDEITFSIPAGDDTYALIERVHKAVLKETEKDTHLAEEEWKRTGRRDGLSQFSAGPAVDMRPGASGIDIIVRYVTRATSRFEVRNRLYQCVIGLLHKPATPA
jgi:small-conductance mechanosensitive channel